MNSFQKLIELFRRFPGIGPRQAERFAYFLLTQNENYIRDLTAEISNLKKESAICTSCFRYYTKNGNTSTLCSICANPNRDHSKVMIVSRNNDLDNIERTKVYDGLYFVLGGSLPILEKEPEKLIRVSELEALVKERAKVLKEIILGLNANAEGENTAQFIESRLKPLAGKEHFKISHLGRGLSTGSELEYSDSDTIVNALKNRT